MLSTKDYLSAIEKTQIVSVDTIIRNRDGKYLLGHRNNKPAQNTWFVPGGKVFKGETLQDAPLRILRTEIGELADMVSNVKFYRVSDHMYDDNFMDKPNVGTHYVCIAITCDIDCDSNVKIKTDDEQHNTWCWLTPQIILDSNAVHKYVKYYFMPTAPNTF